MRCSSTAHTVRGRWFWPAAALGFACLLSLGAEPPPAEGEAQADKVGEVVTETAGDKGKTGQGRGGSLPVTVVLNSVDDHFAPSVETLEIKYTITNGDARFAKIEIYKDGAPKDAIFTVTTITKTEGQATYDWDGRDKDGDYVGPQNSPYTVRISAGARGRLGWRKRGQGDDEGAGGVHGHPDVRRQPRSAQQGLHERPREQGAGLRLL